MVTVAIDMELTGKRIKQCITENDSCVVDLANYLGVTLNAVYKWLHGQCLPTIDNLVAIANYFGTTIDDLVVTRIVECEHER